MITAEEKYLIASNTSNLRVVAESSGAGDVLIAAGWSKSRIGSALMRLHTRPTRDNLELVHTHVAMEANRLHIAHPEQVAGAVIAWWLSRTCPVCFGRKYEAISSTPSLSSIECPKCHGTGEKKLPHGEAGRILANWMDVCKHSHVGMIKKRLRSTD